MPKGHVKKQKLRPGARKISIDNDREVDTMSDDENRKNGIPEEPEDAVHTEASAPETPAEPADAGEPGASAPAEPTVPAEPETPAAPEQGAGETVPAEASAREPHLDGITLALSLCDALLAKVGKDGFHGGVRPDNISVGDQGVALGGKLEHGVGEFTPQELEYMAPELFWDGLRSPAADVYSVGLVLYAIYNHGRMPFWPEKGEASPNARATALQKRMSNEEIAPPAGAGPELAAIILRALAFGAEERWHDAEELRNALGDCQEEQADTADIAATVAGLSARGAAPARTAAPQTPRKKPTAREKDELDSPFVEDVPDEPIPKVRVRRTHRRLAQIVAYTVLALAVVALVILLRQCSKLTAQAEATPTATAAETTDPDGVKIINGNQTAATPTPEPTPTPTPEVTPSPAPTSVQYIAVREDVSWTEAVEKCKAMGGELAMPGNYAEFLEITKACEDAGLSCAWLGAHRDESGNWVTTTGEAATFFAWGDGEPSGKDTDGTAEDYYLLWNLVGGRWSGNDMRENPVAEFPAYSGIIGYVCKLVSYDTVSPSPSATPEA